METQTWFINFSLNRIVNCIDDAECGYSRLGIFTLEAVQVVANDLAMELIVY